ncbi:transposase, partial [Serratia marcescens]|uniref:transposase n=1 Tax=Serratia marcescens TaxID=615 RepID=UPI001653263A
RKHRKKTDWAEEIKYLLTKLYPDKKRVLLVMDNLNTHDISSLYERFCPEEAFSYASRLEIHYTPKHGSWLNIAEIELNAMTRQCLDRRVSDIEDLSKELSAWESERNNNGRQVKWQFTTEDARIKLHSLYPKYE